jgi:hypothetical protein
MVQGTGFQGTYKVRPKPLEEVKVGNWYCGFSCLACTKRFAVFDDPSSGATRVPIGGMAWKLAA